MSSTDSLGRAHELLERLQAQLADLERLAEAGETESAIDALAEAAKLAKEIEVEVQRARTSADAGT
jgi:predicted translin family RNA/ssDNA-binding protein